MKYKQTAKDVKNETSPPGAWTEQLTRLGCD